MIPRIDIYITEPGSYTYQVTYEQEALFEEAGFSSIVLALVSAVEGLAPDIKAVEVSCAGIVSGTYPLQALALNTQQIAEHAAHTTAAVLEALGE
ncbi:hypothetical protein BH09PSE5_BH09PSE5_44590 [soil metagenome]